MEQLDTNTMYILVGVFVAVLVALIAMGYMRRRRQADQISTDVTPPYVTGGAQPARPDERYAVDKALDQMPGAARVPHELLPTHDEGAGPTLDQARIPGADFPEDLEVRPTGSAPVEAPARPHTLDEIQRKPAKPLSSALENTRSSFFGRLKGIFSKKELLQAGELDDLEEILYTSDLGPQTVQRLMSAVEEKVKASGSSGFDAVRDALKAEMLEIFNGIEAGPANGNGHGVAKANGNGHALGNGHAKDPMLAAVEFDRDVVEHAGQEYLEGLEKLNIWSHKPAVLMVVGVNGAGKTTTIGKLARRVAQSGRKVVVAAGDTFRAAAGDQLKVWTDRAAVEIFAPEGVTDPSAVAFDAVQTASAKGFDVVIIDTAGRLHTQKNLMEELKKMKRVIGKVMPDAPHEVLLVLDANNGQNALQQAREFHGALGVTGVVLTKLDGTAKGGVAVGLACELGLPIKLIGVGEGIEDLRQFRSTEFVDSII